MDSCNIEDKDESERAFKKLTDLGYSKLVAKRIYKWYHPE